MPPSFPADLIPTCREGPLTTIVAGAAPTADRDIPCRASPQAASDSDLYSTKLKRQVWSCVGHWGEHPGCDCLGAQSMPARRRSSTSSAGSSAGGPVSYTHLRAHETR